MEAKKIAIACFVGGVLCTAVALISTPMFWWLGLLAGLAGGYLGYEFREVLRAIPIAWRKSRRGVSIWWTETDGKVRDWFAEPHPLAYFITTVAVMPTLALLYGASPMFVDLLEFSLIPKIFLTVVFYIVLFSFIAYIWTVAGVAICFLSGVGARLSERCLWEGWYSETEIQTLKNAKKEGYYSDGKTTYRNFFRWTAKGIVVIPVFLIWKILVGIWRLLCFLKRFGWELFKLIHSKKRVLCAIDGTLGGAIAFFCFASATLTSPQQILVVFFGGLLGAMIGVLNYEIISKRVLHLVSVMSNT